jgi:hypothetical protein
MKHNRVKTGRFSRIRNLIISEVIAAVMSAAMAEGGMVDSSSRSSPCWLESDIASRVRSEDGFQPGT